MLNASPTAIDFDVYQPRNPKANAYYRFVEDHYLHVLATDGCFYHDDASMVCPPPDTGELEKLFRYEVFKMLKAEGKITDF